MANTKSAEKRVRQTKVRTAKNRALKSRVKNAKKAVLAAKEKGDAAALKSTLAELASVADKAANRGVIHKNTADRIKSRSDAAAKKVVVAPVVPEKKVKAKAPAKTASKAPAKKAAKAK